MNPKKHHAFTLVELLAVIAIIGLLAAIIIPVVGRVRASARATQCVSNMRQIGIGLLMFASENKQRFPYANNDAPPGQTPANQPWMWQIASYVGLGTETLGSAPKPRAAGVFLCPSYQYDPVTRKIPYGYNPSISQSNGYESGAPQWNYTTNLTTPSRLFLVVETDFAFDFYLPSQHPGNDVPRRHPGNSANYLFADGHVERISTPTPRSAQRGVGDPRWNYSETQ